MTRTMRFLVVAALFGASACGGGDNASDPYGIDNDGDYEYSNNGSLNNGTTGGNDGYYDAGNNGAIYEGNNTTGGPEPAPNAGENYDELIENDFVAVSEEATSTFSVDVDTASYTLMRRDIESGYLPNKDGVRVEEYINFFDYEYPEPAADDPFSINLEVAPSAFGEELHMLRVGLKGKEISREEMRPVNMVFLIDTSGSMGDDMPLIKYSLKTLAHNLRDQDSIGIVTYASSSGVLLDATPVSEKATILAAIDGLNAGGSTYGEGGLEQAYALAESARNEDGINRVVLVTDGDFNVGVTGQELRDLVEAKRDLHIGLTVGGMGSGNFNDADLEAFARNTNGNYFYIDGEQEADRIFGTEITSTLEVIAADVKVQIEFDAEAVVRYRLVGYENRLLNNEDFADDTKDAGEIGPGHTVTALYEIELAEDVQPTSGFIAEVRLRHKQQWGTDSIEQTQSIKPSQVKATVADASNDLQFTMAVVEFAEILRESMHTDGLSFPDVQTMATASAGDDMKRLEFVTLLGLAAPLLAD